MNLQELDTTNVIEAQLVWARKGKNVSRKYRCEVGPRKGRLVSNPSQCGNLIDLQKRMTLKTTKARKAPRMARNDQRTSTVHPKRVGPHP